MYVISNLDLDDVFLPNLHEFIAFYHAKCEGKVALVNEDFGVTTQNITMAPRELLKELGGWRNLQWSEDWDFWCRAARAQKMLGLFSDWWIQSISIMKGKRHPERYESGTACIEIC